ncbi:MAG TPA: type II secretion system F family protein, partial [Thermosynergistes sp.]|nr:type II secretion system F family protein [Thermosynergistes sp.]
MLFNYRARDLQGAAVEGQIQAQTTEQVVQQLRQQGLIPVRIVEAKNLQTGKASLLERLESISTVSLRDKAVFFRQLSTMTKAGVTLASALDLLSRQTQNKRLARAIVEIKDLIDKGQPFSAALRPQKIFSPLMVAMVAAGEEGGLLDESVERLASLLERQ